MPPAEDLRVEPKPALSEAARESEAVYEQWNIDIEAWGQRGWDTVARICRWADRNGMTGLSCPPAN